MSAQKSNLSLDPERVAGALARARELAAEFEHLRSEAEQIAAQIRRLVATWDLDPNEVFDKSS